MDHCRRLLIAFLCLAIALAGRGPVTELGAFGNGHAERTVSAAPAPHGAVAHAGNVRHAHAHGHGSHEGSIADGHAHGAGGPRGDTCACGCDMGSCAAMPADLSLQHPDLARIDPRIDLPALRTAPHAPSPMAPLLRPPIG